MKMIKWFIDFNKTNSNYLKNNSSDKFKAESSICSINIFFMVFGIIANIISIAAFSQKNLRKRKFNWYLLILAIFELIFCLAVFADNIFMKISEKKIYLHALNKISGIIIDFTVHTTDSYTTVLTVLLSLDRLYAIRKPMKIKQFITNLHAKKLILFSFKTEKT
jgi:hypothetical protein